MLLEIQKWGNSAAIRLSQGLLREFSSEIGSKVRASVANGKLTLEPEVEIPEYSLDERACKKGDLVADGKGVHTSTGRYRNN